MLSRVEHKRVSIPVDCLSSKRMAGYLFLNDMFSWTWKWRGHADGSKIFVDSLEVTLDSSQCLFENTLVKSSFRIES